MRDSKLFTSSLEVVHLHLAVALAYRRRPVGAGEGLVDLTEGAEPRDGRRRYGREAVPQARLQRQADQRLGAVVDRNHVDLLIQAAGETFQGEAHAEDPEDAAGLAAKGRWPTTMDGRATTGGRPGSSSRMRRSISALDAV